MNANVNAVGHLETECVSALQVAGEGRVGRVRCGAGREGTGGRERDRTEGGGCSRAPAHAPRGQADVPDGVPARDERAVPLLAAHGARRSHSREGLQRSRSWPARIRIPRILPSRFTFCFTHSANHYSFEFTYMYFRFSFLFFVNTPNKTLEKKFA